MIENNGSSGRRSESRHSSEKLTWSVTLTIRKVTLHVSARQPPLKHVRETWAVVNGLYLQGWIAGSKVSFLVDTGSVTGAQVLGADEASSDLGDSCNRLGLHSGGYR